MSGYCPVTVRLLSGLLPADVQMDRTRSNRPPLLGSVSRYSRAGSIERVVFCENRSATKGRAASGSVLTTDVACTAVGVQTTRTLTSYQSVTHQRTRRRQGSTQFFETIARSLTVANNRTLPPPSNCQGAEHAPFPPGLPPQKPARWSSRYVSYRWLPEVPPRQPSSSPTADRPAGAHRRPLQLG